MMDWFREKRKSAEMRREERSTAYVDGQLSAAERTRFEAEMAEDERLQADVAALQQVKSALSNLPTQPVPHNFLLDPAAYRKPAPAYGARAYPVLRGATALAALVFIFAMSFSFFPFGGATSEQATAFINDDAQVEGANLVAEPMATMPQAAPKVFSAAERSEEESADGEMADEASDDEASAEMSFDAADYDSASEGLDFATEDMADGDADYAAELEHEADIAILSSEIAETVEVTISQAAPLDLIAVEIEDSSLTEMQTVDPVEQSTWQSLAPSMRWSIFFGTLFIILLVSTMLIRRRL